MAGYLCLWNVDGPFLWPTLSEEAARTKRGQRVERRWKVENTKNIPINSRIFLKACGSVKGLMASGRTLAPPVEVSAVAKGSVVYQSQPYKLGTTTQELDLSAEPCNFVMVEFDAILPPQQALTIKKLEGIGNLGAMYWNQQGGGVRIQPRRKHHYRGDVMPELEETWSRHLEEVGFEIETDEELRTATTECSDNVTAV